MSSSRGALYGYLPHAGRVIASNKITCAHVSGGYFPTTTDLRLVAGDQEANDMLSLYFLTSDEPKLGMFCARIQVDATGLHSLSVPRKEMAM